LIRQIIHDKDIYLYVEHIANFAKQLNLQLIAEHVESKPIANALKKANVTLMQGNYFAEPVPHITANKNQPYPIS
jgi:EAL domain-containing protein (putative c-di-GMP-specific phosphodiesterase class I)